MALFVMWNIYAITCIIINPVVMKTLIFVSFSLILFSCNLIDFNDRGFIDPEIKPYVDSFVNEAEKRGIYIDVSELKISFKDLSKYNVNGRTYPTTKRIYIDPNKEWKWEPEALVFHEMGHLYLKRDDEKSMVDKNGNPKSIMNSPGVPSYARSLYRRDYYIDELFNSNTPPPKWAYDE